MPEMSNTHAQNDSITGRLRRGIMVLPALLTVLAGCSTGGDSVTQPRNRVESIPWSLNLNHRAILTTVGTPVQLTTSPKAVDGTPISGLPPVVYTTSDTSLKVDATGRLIGNVARPNVMFVYATAQSLDGNWTIADTARVAVVAAPYAFSKYQMDLSSTGLRPNPDGPPLLPANRVLRFDALVYDAADNPLMLPRAGNPDTTVKPVTYYTKSVPDNVYYIGNRWNGTGTSRNVGEVTIRGRSHIFGQDYQDSVTFRVTYPDSADLFIYPLTSFQNPSPNMMSQTNLTILRGGKVGFRKSASTTPTVDTDIVFDDQANVIGGNITVVPKAPALSAIVTFPNTGKFTYKSSEGFGGTITVVDP
jgi:hypothetical protein